MPARNDDGTWRYRKVIKLENGKSVRISGTPQINTKRAAEDAERKAIEDALKLDTIARYAPEASIVRAAAPTLSTWFRGRYWTEHALGEKQNRPGTQEVKLGDFERHVEPMLGATPIDQIDLGAVNRLRAELASKKSERTGKALSAKTQGNILGVLSSALNYAEDAGAIKAAPRIRVKSIKAPEVERWTFDQYARIVGSAIVEGATWHVAVLLAGDCGLRIGEILAADYKHADLVAGILQVAQTDYRGKLGPTKGGAPREVPLTPRLVEAIRSLPQIRKGRIVRGEDGEPITESIARNHMHRICRRAGLPEHLWHTGRHTFASHCALLGASPYRLQAWLGHSTFALTMRYVSWASAHRWPVPPEVLAAGAEEVQPDRRITLQLGARPVVAPAAPAESRSNRRAARSKRAACPPLSLVASGS